MQNDRISIEKRNEIKRGKFKEQNSIKEQSNTKKQNSIKKQDNIKNRNRFKERSIKEIIERKIPKIILSRTVSSSSTTSSSSITSASTSFQITTILNKSATSITSPLEVRRFSRLLLESSPQLSIIPENRRLKG